MRAKQEHSSYHQKFRSFQCFRIKKQRFEFYWHCHPEIELTYIISGEGKRQVGDSIEPFTAGDLVLAGSWLPHTWVSDKNFTGKCEAIVLHFREELLTGWLALPEFMQLDQLLKNAPFGVCFSARVANRHHSLFLQLVKEEGSLALVKMMEILCFLAKEKRRLLFHALPQTRTPMQHQARVNRVLRFIENNHGEKINLQQAADIMHLSKSAFCKFFKKQLGKNFTAYLNEIRINKACFSLLQTDTTVKEIAYQCGFENTSYFNRIFFRIKRVSPMQYRKKGKL